MSTDAAVKSTDATTALKIIRVSGFGSRRQRDHRAARV